ncbi:hypothetical protein FRC12_020071, partial [Ceratobasidium sp. 428]
AICNDPNLYPEPELFKPERFLDPLVPSAPGFGYGRRWAISTRFDIRPKLDECGNELLPEFKKGPNVMISYPQPFECSITPRSTKHEAVLRRWVEL